MVKRKLWEVWSEYETDTKKIWKVAFPKGILGFSTKREAVRQAEGWKKGYKKSISAQRIANKRRKSE